VTPAQQSALDFYVRQKGLTKEVAVGIVSVLSVESAMNPTAENNSGTDKGGAINPNGAYGLAQWNGPRQDALQAFASRYVMDEASADCQLAFVLTEAANSFPDLWKEITSPSTMYSDLITVMVDSYEIPANKQAEISKAAAVANDLYANYAPAPSPGPAPAPVPTPTPIPVPQIDLQTVQALIDELSPLLPLLLRLALALK